MSLAAKISAYTDKHDLSDFHIRSNQPIAMRIHGEVNLFADDLVTRQDIELFWKSTLNKAQLQEIVTTKDYQNKIYVADFFFTTCPSICPKMTENMGLIQKAIKDDSQIQLVSFSVTPKIDSVAQLKRYAIEKGVLDSKWNLLTGDKKMIYNLARKSFLAAKNHGDGGPQDMIHTENFVLVDPDKRIRGFYDGTNTLAMETLLLDIKTLQKEYSYP